MCNAWNHPPDCDCGFGPPYRWRIQIGTPRTWYESSLLNRASYRHHLGGLGFSRREISTELQRYCRHDFPLSADTWAALSTQEKTDWKTRFLTFFGLYKCELLEQTELKIDIPIFRLHSPAVEKSKVTFEMAHTDTTADAWSVTVMGCGTGHSQEFRLTNKSEFSSEGGDCKLVCLPVTLRLTRLNLYRRGNYLRTVLRVEPSPDYRREIMNEGVRPQPAGACLPASCAIIAPAQVYPLADESPRSLAKYTRQWESEAKKEFSAGVEALGLKGLCQATVRRRSAITLTIHLPGGHDYRMYPLQEPDGLVWEAVG